VSSSDNDGGEADGSESDAMTETGLTRTITAGSRSITAATVEEASRDSRDGASHSNDRGITASVSASASAWLDWDSDSD
jgi:hypothetical protein